jgi:nucleoid DNA-binding protein
MRHRVGSCHAQMGSQPKRGRGPKGGEMKKEPAKKIPAFLSGKFRIAA